MSFPFCVIQLSQWQSICKAAFLPFPPCEWRVCWLAICEVEPFIGIPKGKDEGEMQWIAKDWGLDQTFLFLRW